MNAEHPRRYFTCSAVNGELYIHYVGAITGASRSYVVAEDVDDIFHPDLDRRIHSVDELDDVLRLTTDLIPVGLLFVAEGLEDEAERRIKTPSKQS